MLHRRLGVLLLVSLLGAVSVTAQPVDLTPERFSFDPELTYNEEIPSPSEALGYEIGTQFSLHAHVVDYLETVADRSDRVTLGRYGETYEGRPLIYLTITSAENQGQLDQLKRKIGRSHV